MATEKKRITIANVAEAANVSTQTISRVINRSPEVREATRRRVLKVIGELSYEPSTLARGLAANRSRLIAMVYDNENVSYVSEFQRGVLSHCIDEGYELIVRPCAAGDSVAVQNLSNFIRRLGVDGIILLPPLGEREELVKRLGLLGCSYVRTASVSLDSPDRMVVSNDRKYTGRIAEHLTSLGHTQLACIKGPDSERSSLEKMAGFEAYLNKVGIELEPEMVVIGDYSMVSGERCALDLLTRNNRPTAIFASNDLMAVGALKAAHRLGLDVPRDLSIAGFDDAPIASQIWPTLTTLRAPAESLGKLAAQKVIAQTTGAKSIEAEFKYDLIIRETTGSAPG